MSLYALTPRPGFERYTIQAGWNPHRTLFCTVADLDVDTDPGNPPDLLHLGLMDDVLDPADIVAAVEPYAVIPDDLIERLHTDMATHPVRHRR